MVGVLYIICFERYDLVFSQPHIIVATKCNIIAYLLCVFYVIIPIVVSVFHHCLIIRHGLVSTKCRVTPFKSGSW